MADPATLGLIGSAVSGVFGFVGQMQQASAQAAQANYQAQVARNNQQIAQQQAIRSEEAGQEQAQQRDFANRARTGGILAAEAASGIDTSSTTSKDVRDAAARLGRLDTATVYSNAQNTVYGQEAQATSFGAQAGLDQLTARNAQTAGLFGGFGSLIGGATSFADKWIRYQNQGLSVF